MKKVVAIIQARMGSTRLPNKMMLSLHGKPIIEWVIKRVQKSKLVDEIILATSQNRENDILVNYAEKLGIKIFRGSENDVLNRFYLAGKEFQASHIIRICADNPLIDGEEIDNLINFYFQNSYDYVYNHIPKNNNYPDGLGAEIVSFDILEKLEKEVTSSEEREHLFLNIVNNQDNFSVATFEPKKEIAYPNLRFDIDSFEDYYYMSMKDIDIDIDSQELVNKFRK